jgi:hypothetical protein
VSLAEDVKSELSVAPSDKACCRDWERRGFLECWGQQQSPRLRVAADYGPVARRLYALLRDAGAERVKVARRPNGGYVVVAVRTQAAAMAPAADILPRTRCCRRSYLRGCFLARGFLSTTGHGYHWEVKTPSESQAGRVRKVLDTLGLRGTRVGRWQRGWVTYMKDSTQIADWLRSIGAHGSLLELENTLVQRDMRNRVTRQVNYETANVERTVNAAMRHIADIELIAKTIGLPNLPPALRALAEARLAQPDANLAELAASLDPPISKSGVSHRLRRIAAWADRVRQDQSRRGASRVPSR